MPGIVQSVMKVLLGLHLFLTKSFIKQINDAK